MTTLSRGAMRDFTALARDFRRKNRPEATRNLLAALSQAMKQIATDPNGGLVHRVLIPALPSQAGRG